MNVATVLVGGGAGALAGARLPHGMRQTALNAIGIFTLLIGVANFLEHDNPLIPLASVIAVLGWGVLLSAGTVLVVQGSITLGAGLIEGVITDPMISAATATGGVLIFGLGLGLLEIREVRVANMLPALAVAPVLVAAAPLWPL